MKTSKLILIFLLCLLLTACHKHTFTDTWSYDDSYHWHSATCSHTDEISDKNQHVFSEVHEIQMDEYYTLKAFFCETCGYWFIDESQFLEYFTLTEDGVLSVGDENHMKHLPESVYIPESINGIKIKKIANGAFMNCEKMIRVRIPDSVSSIGQMAFYNCSSLVGIKIPDSVTEMGHGGFAASGIEYAELPSGINAIPKSFFQDCEKLNQVSIPSLGTVKEIGAGAFYNCKSLKTIKIPDGCELIDTSAFENCTLLEGIELNNSLKSIGKNAFKNTGLIRVEIPSRVNHIASGAFSDCNSLEYVSIPKALDLSVNDGPILSNCPRLAEIAFEAEYPSFVPILKTDKLFDSTISSDCLIFCLDGYYSAFNGNLVKENFSYYAKQYTGLYEVTPFSLAIASTGFNSSHYLFRLVCNDSVIKEVSSWKMSDYKVDASNKASITISIADSKNELVSVIIRDGKGTISFSSSFFIEDDWTSEADGSRAIGLESTDVSRAMHFSPDKKWLVWNGIVFEKTK